MDAKVWDISDDEHAVEPNLHFRSNEVTRPLKPGTHTIPYHGLVSEIRVVVTSCLHPLHHHGLSLPYPPSEYRSRSSALETVARPSRTPESTR